MANYQAGKGPAAGPVARLASLPLKPTSAKASPESEGSPLSLAVEVVWLPKNRPLVYMPLTEPCIEKDRKGQRRFIPVIYCTVLSHTCKSTSLFKLKPYITLVQQQAICDRIYECGDDDHLIPTRMNVWTLQSRVSVLTAAGVKSQKSRLSLATRSTCQHREASCKQCLPHSSSSASRERVSKTIALGLSAVTLKAGVCTSRRCNRQISDSEQTYCGGQMKS